MKGIMTINSDRDNVHIFSEYVPDINKGIDEVESFYATPETEEGKVLKEVCANYY